ncbi:hypothetical protein ACHHYP_02430 [Achlya hypogyna]|uniref:Neurotransmitter-gated ion-channel ligand-binding domain-containing protein n=1 Tax=Achlya hypogyna TaxID=1202772 RepID=A0A1V9Z6E3_ACHHY|nr:hypothetical protein ACHHYP_02430 [Achlya hypogyna]
MPSLRVQPTTAITPVSSRWTSEVISYTLVGKRLNVEVVHPVPEGELKASTMLIAFVGGPGGLWKVDQAKGAIITCMSTRQKADEGLENESCPWEIVLERPDANPTIRHKTEGACTVTLLPPLLLHCRTTIFNVYRIDTVAQTFDADVYFELRLRAIATRDADKEWIEEVATAIGLTMQKIDCLNIITLDGERERWTMYSQRGSIPNRVDYCFKVRCRGSFSEQLELENFPFDQQQLHVIWSVNLPQHYVRLRPNDHYPSLFLHNNFQQANVFSVATDEHVIATVEQSDPAESSSGFVYDHCKTSIVLQRKPGYYVTNIIVPMGVLTYLGYISFAVDSPGVRLGTGDRLSISLTLLLTAVAYKFVVAGAIPQIPYMTTLDRYTTFSFVYLCAIALENAIFPAACAGDGCFESENTLLAILLAAFTVGNVSFAFTVHVNLRRRDALLRGCMEYHLLQLLVAQEHPTLSDAERTTVLAELCKEMKIKPLTSLDNVAFAGVTNPKKLILSAERKKQCRQQLDLLVAKIK